MSRRSKVATAVPTSLEHLAVGRAARVASLDGGIGFRQNVQAIGLSVGQELRKVEHAGMGPILIELDGQRIALGCGIARRIIVEELPDGG